MPREITFQEFVDALGNMSESAVHKAIDGMMRDQDEAMAAARSKGLRVEATLTVRTLDGRKTLADVSESVEITRDKFVMREDDV